MMSTNTNEVRDSIEESPAARGRRASVPARLSAEKLDRAYVKTLESQVKTLNSALAKLNKAHEKLKQDCNALQMRLNAKEYREKASLGKVRNQAHYHWGWAIERAYQNGEVSARQWELYLDHAYAIGSSTHNVAIGGLEWMGTSSHKLSKPAHRMRFLWGHAVETALAYPPTDHTDPIDLHAILERNLSSPGEILASEDGLKCLEQFARKPPHLRKLPNLPESEPDAID